jgi:hypothetical protein
MAHTEGPLTTKAAGAFTEDDGLDVAILDSEGRIIGEAYYQVGPDDFRPAEDNARLWASAPDLLVALRTVEWIQPPWPAIGHEPFCPWCGNYKSDDHRLDCARQIALDKSPQT